MKQQIERLAQRAGIDHLRFASIDLDSIYKNSGTRVNYQAASYLARWVPAVEIKCNDLRLFGKEEILEESSNLLPGCLVSHLGFISIGATRSGDVFALDCEAGKVYELSHENYNEDSISPGWNSDFSDFLPDVPITRDNVVETAERAFEDIDQFFDFLDQVTA